MQREEGGRVQESELCGAALGTQQREGMKVLL